MKSLFSSIVIAVCVVTTLQGQDTNKKYFDRIVFGQSLTLIPDAFERPNRFYHKEYTWNTNLSVNINQRLRVGMQYLAIFTTQNNQNQQRFQMFGASVQYNLIPNLFTNGRFYAEINGNKGNYCTCDPDVPYRKDGLNYLGYGFGFDIPIRKWVHLDLAFLNYNILNKIEGKYNYTQYIIGLDFPFVLKK